MVFHHDEHRYSPYRHENHPHHIHTLNEDSLATFVDPVKVIAMEELPYIAPTGTGEQILQATASNGTGGTAQYWIPYESTAGTAYEYAEWEYKIPKGYYLYPLKGATYGTAGSGADFFATEEEFESYRLYLFAPLTATDEFHNPYAQNHSYKNVSISYSEFARMVYGTLISSTMNTVSVNLMNLLEKNTEWHWAGTADFASTAGTALYAEYAGTSDYAYNAERADTAATADFAILAGTADFAGTANYASTAGTSFFAEKAGSADFAGTAEYAKLAGTSAYAEFAGTAQAAIHSQTADYATFSGTADVSLHAITADSATLAGTATYSSLAGTASVSLLALTSNYADFAGSADYAVKADLASLASNAIHALLSDRAGTSDFATFSSTASLAYSAIHADYAGTSDYSSFAGTAYLAYAANTSDFAGTASNSLLLGGYSPSAYIGSVNGISPVYRAGTASPSSITVFASAIPSSPVATTGGTSDVEAELRALHTEIALTPPQSGTENILLAGTGSFIDSGSRINNSGSFFSEINVPTEKTVSSVIDYRILNAIQSSITQLGTIKDGDPAPAIPSTAKEGDYWMFIYEGECTWLADSHGTIPSHVKNGDYAMLTGSPLAFSIVENVSSYATTAVFGLVILATQEQADAGVDTVSIPPVNLVKSMVDSAVSVKLDKTAVYDALDSTSTSNALSANQGKVLNTKIVSLETGYDCGGVA